MTDVKATDTPTFKPKKSVALSGTAAGNTALCTVGRTGNDLHYRGYDILDIATTCEFEEIAYLLIHGTLPSAVASTTTRAQRSSPRVRRRGSSIRGTWIELAGRRTGSFAGSVLARHVAQRDGRLATPAPQGVGGGEDARGQRRIGRPGHVDSLLARRITYTT